MTYSHYTTNQFLTNKIGIKKIYPNKNAVSHKRQHNQIYNQSKVLPKGKRISGTTNATEPGSIDTNRPGFRFTNKSISI